MQRCDIQGTGCTEVLSWYVGSPDSPSTGTRNCKCGLVCYHSNNSRASYSDDSTSHTLQSAGVACTLMRLQEPRGIFLLCTVKKL